MYIDYFIKKISEIFLKNFLVLGALFFSEKFLIEHFSKKIFNNWVFFLNKLNSILNFCLSSAFYYVTLFIFLVIFVLEIFIILK